MNGAVVRALMASLPLLATLPPGASSFAFSGGYLDSLSADPGASLNTRGAPEVSQEPPPASVTRVVAAAVVREGRVLVARRTRPPSLAGLWEFPGGKVDSGESDGAALAREMVEELGLPVDIGTALGSSEQSRPTPLQLTAYAARPRDPGSEPRLADGTHDDFRWVVADELERLALAPLDVPFVPTVRALLASDGGLKPGFQEQEGLPAPAGPMAEQQDEGTTGGTELSNASKYLDSNGASYLDSLADGRWMRRQQQNQPTSPVPPTGSPPLDDIEYLKSRIVALEDELSNLKAENRAVRSAADDLLRRYYTLAEHLDEMEGQRLELASLTDRWEGTMLKIAEESFPDEQELESYEWLLRR